MPVENRRNELLKNSGLILSADGASVDELLLLALALGNIGEGELAWFILSEQVWPMRERFDAEQFVQFAAGADRAGYSMEAGVALMEALRLEPDHHKANLLKANLLLRAGLIERANDHLQFVPPSNETVSGLREFVTEQLQEIEAQKRRQGELKQQQEQAQREEKRLAFEQLKVFMASIEDLSCSDVEEYLLESRQQLNRYIESEQIDRAIELGEDLKSFLEESGCIDMPSPSP